MDREDIICIILIIFAGIYWAWFIIVMKGKIK